MLNSPIEEIKSKLDIIEVIGSYIKLQKAGANYRAICPFHSEKSPSFFISPARQIWHCFGSCGEGGDIFKFIMKIEGVEFGEALKILAQKAGIELKKFSPEDLAQNNQKERLFQIIELACKFFEKQLESSQQGLAAKQYLLNRGVSEESIKKWRLGYSADIWSGLLQFLTSNNFKIPEIEKTGLILKSEKSGKYFDRFRGRIMFPILNLSSRIVGFGGRTLKKDEPAKYINSPATLLYDKSRILFGLDKASLEIRKSDACILVEGYMDCIMAHQGGTPNTVATSGTALTSFQLKILKRYTNNLYTSFDMDSAGKSATGRGVDLAQAEGFDIKVVVLPGDKDPADLVLRDSALWVKSVQEAKSIHDFYFSTVLSKFDANTPEGKKEISKFILPIIKKIPNKIEQGVWIKDLSEKINVKEEYVLAELNRIAAPIKEEKKVKNLPEAKTRKDLLQERLAMLMIKSPIVCQFINRDDLKYFSLKKIATISYLIENKGEIADNLPEELSQEINRLFLKAESEPAEGDFDLEFKDCLNQLKIIYGKERLSDISREIKQAEQENNASKIQELIQKFNQETKFLEES